MSQAQRTLAVDGDVRHPERPRNRQGRARIMKIWRIGVIIVAWLALLALPT
jgi:hypothetical protein